jgi:hypothetical protein
MCDPGKVVFVHSHWRHLPGTAAAATGFAASGGLSWLAGVAAAVLPVAGAAVLGTVAVALAAGAVSDLMTPEEEKQRRRAEREAREAEQRRIEAERRRREAQAVRVFITAVCLVGAACLSFVFLVSRH